jgi:hypothetical protein
MLAQPLHTMIHVQTMLLDPLHTMVHAAKHVKQTQNGNVNTVLLCLRKRAAK